MSGPIHRKKYESLKYAYLGNVPGHPLEHTYCPECKNIVIECNGYSIGSWNFDNNCCKKCGYPLPITGMVNRTRKNLFQIVQ